MAIDGIKISLGEVTATAGTIQILNASLNARLSEIKQEMNNLASTWQSDASSTIREKFNALQPRFEEYSKVVEAYATFLNSTVTSYDSTETLINNNASMFK